MDRLNLKPTHKQVKNYFEALRQFKNLGVSHEGAVRSALAFDGMRKHLAQDFDEIYILDLGGNVRKNPKLSGTTHNVFGIQVGVSINLFVRKRSGVGANGNGKGKCPERATEGSQGQALGAPPLGRVNEIFRAPCRGAMSSGTPSGCG